MWARMASARWLGLPSLFAVTWSFASLLACSASDDDSSATGSRGQAAAGASACVAHEAPAASALSAPPTTFADVAPIFTQSCAFSACHASHSSSNHGLFLAPKNDDDEKSVKAGLAAKSRALPAMPYVTPGNPSESFLMRKLDGDQCVLDARCAGGSCGDSMPQGNPLLTEAARDTVRRWIAQGAK